MPCSTRGADLLPIGETGERVTACGVKMKARVRRERRAGVIAIGMRGSMSGCCVLSGLTLCLAYSYGQACPFGRARSFYLCTGVVCMWHMCAHMCTPLLAGRYMVVEHAPHCREQRGSSERSWHGGEVGEVGLLLPRVIRAAQLGAGTMVGGAEHS